MPENWVQHPVINTEEGTNPGAPLAWGSPENPDDVVAGYGYVPCDTSEVEETFYYHSDPLGSTAYITDQNANVTQYDAYLPYGELLVDEHSSSADLPYKFNGKELDEETGLYYYGARYMNPLTSMWYGVDPLAEKYVLTGSYVYCLGNPVKLVDPDGKAVETIWDAANVAIGVASLIDNVKAGNIGAAIVDGIGVAADATATAVPFVPGGAGTAIKAYRAGKTAAKAVKASSVVKAGKTAKTANRTSKVTRRAEFRQAKRDVGIPMSQHPQKCNNKQYDKVDLTDSKGKRMLDKYGKPIQSREYHFDGPNGEVIIQEHSLGHPQFSGDAAKPHFNVRPKANPRTGKYPNTKGHYVFSKK